MRKPASLVLAALFAALSIEGVAACGDKLLLASRDFAYSRTYAAIHPAAVLIYVPKAATSRGTAGGLASVLKRAGHQPEVVGDLSLMTERLRSGQVDVVLADIVNMPKVETASVDCPSKPVFLPVVFDPSASTLDAAIHQYRFALSAPQKANEFLKAIDQAMEMEKRPGHVARKQKH